MPPGAHKIHSQLDNEFINTFQLLNTSHPADQANMDDRTSSPPLQRTDYSSMYHQSPQFPIHTPCVWDSQGQTTQSTANGARYNIYAEQTNIQTGFESCLNTHNSNNMSGASSAEFGSELYYNQPYIHDAFIASQGVFDDKASGLYAGMTPEGYRQMMNGFETAGYPTPTLLNNGFDGQFEDGPMTGDCATRVGQAPEQSMSTVPQSVDNNSSFQQFHYPPLQEPGYPLLQDPFLSPQGAYTGHYQVDNLPQQSLQPPIMDAPRAPTTFVEYPTTPQKQKTTRKNMKTTQPNSPTPTPDNKTRKTSKKPTKSGQAYQQRKRHPCPEPDCTHLATCRSNLEQHMLIHSGERTYRCDEEGCTKKFARPWSLSRHYRDVHGRKYKVNKIGGVRNVSPSEQSPSRRHKKVKMRELVQSQSRCDSCVQQISLPRQLSPITRVGSSSNPGNDYESRGASSPSNSEGVFSSSGNIDHGSNLPSTPHGHGITDSVAGLSFSCPECRFLGPSWDDLACHCHIAHQDPCNDHCGCTMCWGHRQQQQQQQQLGGFEIFDIYADQQEQAQSQAQAQVHAAQQGDVDMTIDPENSDFTQDGATPITQHTPANYDSPMAFMPSTNTSTNTNTSTSTNTNTNTDMDLDLDLDPDLDARMLTYASPSPTTPWTPSTIDTNPNLDPFALDTEMTAYLADAKTYPIN